MARRRALTSQFDWYLGGTVAASFNPPAGTFPALEINQEKGVGGWFSLPDADDAAIDAPAGRAGERVFPRTSRGKTLVFNLRLREGAEGSYVDLSEDLNDFTAVFADRSSLGLLVATPWEGLGDDPAAVDMWATFARVIDFDADDLLAYGPGRQPSPHMRDPILSVRQLDGIWIWLNESGTPFTPMEWSDPGGAVVVTNNGNAPAAPTITVSDVDLGEDLHVGRDAVGAFPAEDLWFRNPVAAAGLSGTHDVVVDFPQRKCWIGTTDVTKCYDAAQSSWWDEFKPGIPPGSFNVWRGPGAGADIDVHFYSCGW